MHNLLLGLSVGALLGILSGCRRGFAPARGQTRTNPAPSSRSTTATRSATAAAAGSANATGPRAAAAGRSRSPSAPGCNGGGGPPAGTPVEPLLAENLPPGIGPDSPDARSLANLKAIAQAMAAYHQHEKGTFPPR